MENRNSKDYVINKYIFEEHEKYFTIKYKKESSQNKNNDNNYGDEELFN